MAGGVGCGGRRQAGDFLGVELISHATRGRLPAREARSGGRCKRIRERRLVRVGVEMAKIAKQFVQVACAVQDAHDPRRPQARVIDDQIGKALDDGEAKWIISQFRPSSSRERVLPEMPSKRGHGSPKSLGCRGAILSDPASGFG